MDNLTNYARRLRRIGIICIPIYPGSKHISFGAMNLPAYHSVTASKGLKDLAYQSLTFYFALQPPTEAEIVRWFTDHAGNIGIVGGYRGLIILDFDSVIGFDRWSRRYPLIANKTPVEKTPHGYHVYLRFEKPVHCTSMYFNERKVGHVTGFGGYVACSPSILEPGLRYGWLPHQSPFDVEPAVVPDLRAISLYPTGWLRRHIRRLMGRETFETTEHMSREEFRSI